MSTYKPCRTPINLAAQSAHSHIHMRRRRKEKKKSVDNVAEKRIKDKEMYVFGRLEKLSKVKFLDDK